MARYASRWPWLFQQKVPTRSPGSMPSRVRAAASFSARVGHLGEGGRAVPALLDGDDGAVAVHLLPVAEDVADQERGVLHGAFHAPSMASAPWPCPWPRENDGSVAAPAGWLPSPAPSWRGGRPRTTAPGVRPRRSAGQITLRPRTSWRRPVPARVRRRQTRARESPAGPRRPEAPGVPPAGSGRTPGRRRPRQAESRPPRSRSRARPSEPGALQRGDNERAEDQSADQQGEPAVGAAGRRAGREQ